MIHNQGDENSSATSGISEPIPKNPEALKIPTVAVDDMSFGYGREKLFAGLNLQMQRGNIYGLLGLNGAGKTTLMKLLIGLLFPQSGTISTMGENPSRRSPRLLSRIFMLSEELYVPSITEKEYCLSMQPFYPDFDRELFERYLGEFEIPRKKRLNKLSYGQKKKFLLSFGLACGSELLVLDEPTNGLDIPSKGLFRRLVAEALSDERIFILSTHQVRDVDSLIDPIIILHQGKVLFNYGIAEIAERMHMQHSATPPDANALGLLHCEATVGGYWSVWQGPGSPGSPGSLGSDGGPIDLEVLFNAVISRPELCAKLFGSEGALV